MLFNSAIFALFLPVMLAVYWGLRGSARRVALLVGSYVFYAWWDWRFLGLLVLSTVVDFGCGRAIEKRRSGGGSPSRGKPFLLISLVTNLGILASFKYFDFFRESATAALGAIGLTLDLPVIDVILPMGISFYTFQTMSYTIDVYRGGASERSPLTFALFVACFPQLVAGPIMRAGELIPQLRSDRRFDRGDFSTGLVRVFRGLFKKMIVADMLGLYVDQVFADPASVAGVSCWIALYAYAFQIYMDFSGYTDVALGVGRMLGLRLAENFDRPYLATSPSDFWRRWHITLSTWLRDYLYIPLGGSRFGRWLTLRNLTITMLLGGLWHGAAWTFVAWGGYHGALLVGQRLLRGRSASTRETSMTLPVRILQIVGMFHLTCLGWLLFRAQDWATVQVMLGRLVDFTDGEVVGKRCAIVLACCAAAHAAPGWRSAVDWFNRLPAMGQGVAAGVCMWVLVLVSPGVRPFVYFQF